MNLLYLTYFYPPLNRCATHQIAGRVKFLRRYGWNPLVITVDQSSRRYADVEFFMGVKEYIAGITHQPKSEFNQPTLSDHLESWFVGPARYPLMWSVKGEALADDLLKSRQIDAIFAEYPIPSTLFMAHRLSLKWRVPWVANLHDIAGEHPPLNPLQFFTIIRHRWAEYRVLKSAAEIIVVTPTLKDILQNRFRRQVHLVTNGFDPDIFFPAEEQKQEQFKMVYTGSIRSYPGLKIIGDALDQLIRNKLIAAEQILIELYGVAETTARIAFGHSTLWPRVRIRPWVSLKEIAKVQRESTVLMLNSYPNSTGILTGKIFEYLASRRPILAAPSDGDCIDKFIQKTRSGYICSTVTETRDVLLRLYQEWLRQGFLVSQAPLDIINRYSFDSVARQISNILSQVVERERRKHFG